MTALLPQKAEEIQKMHQQWMQHPGTSLVFQALESMREQFVEGLTRGAIDQLKSDALIRQQVINLNNLETVMKVLKSSDLIIKQLTKQQ